MKLFLSVLMLSAIWVSCTKPITVKEDPVYESSFTGKWVLQNATGAASSDTLYFRTDNRLNLLRFNYSTPGPGSTVVEVIYKYENKQFFYDDYINPGAGFYHVTSFRWIRPGEQFKVRLRDIIRSVSSDYYVTYIKLR